MSMKTKQMVSIPVLIKNSWSIYVNLFKHMLFFVFTYFLIQGTSTLAYTFFELNTLYIFIFALFVFVLPLLNTIPMVALITLISRRGKGTDSNSLFSIAKERALPLYWTSILYLLSIFIGSTLLIIPGLMAMILFYFSFNISVIEKISGIKALAKSYSYVRGRFWPVLVRLLPVIIFSGSQTLIGNYLANISSFEFLRFIFKSGFPMVVLWPLEMIYIQLIYEDIKSINTNNVKS